MEVIIQSHTGRPIFYCSSSVNNQSNDEFDYDVYSTEHSTLCALIQTTVANLTRETNEFDTHKQSFATFRSENTIVGLLAAKNLIFVAICRSMKDTCELLPTEAFIRLTLEYLYCQILFVLTNQVHLTLEETPNFDVRYILGSDIENLLYLLVKRASHNGGNSGSFLASAVEVVTLDPIIRKNISAILKRHVHHALYALFLFQGRLVCCVQPKRQELWLRCVDLHLLLHFIQNQPGLKMNESWVPICLPRFDSAGAVFAYSKFLRSDLALVFVCPSDDQSIFSSFRISFNSICQDLGLIDNDNTVYHNFDPGADNRPVKSIEASTTEKHYFRMKQYCASANCIHFLYRWDMPSNANRLFSQMLSAPIEFPFEIESTIVWTNYQKLALMMRGKNCNGALRTSSHYNYQSHSHDDSFQGQDTFSSRPSDNQTNNIAFITGPYETFFCLSGSDYELYTVFPGILPIENIEYNCKALVEILKQDEDELFITKNFTWDKQGAF